MIWGSPKSSQIRVFFRIFQPMVTKTSAAPPWTRLSADLASVGLAAAYTEASWRDGVVYST